VKEIVVGIVVNQEGKVLVIERAKYEQGSGNATLTWAFPGGSANFGESKDEAVSREIREETGRKTKAVRIISDRDHPQFPVHIYYMECELVSDELEEVTDPEIAQSKWMYPQELRRLVNTNIDPKVAEFLKLEDQKE
jgi:8-oxo-dGTP diphosphatase